MTWLAIIASISSIVGVATATGSDCANAFASPVFPGGDVARRGLGRSRAGDRSCRPRGPSDSRPPRSRGSSREEASRVRGSVLVGVAGQGGGIDLAVGPDAALAGRDLARLDQLLADLRHQVAADADLLGQPAVGPVVMEPHLHLDRPSTLGAGQGQAVGQVRRRDEVEGLGERAVADLGRGSSAAPWSIAAAWRWKPSARSQRPSTSKTVTGGIAAPGVGVTLDRVGSSRSRRFRFGSRTRSSTGNSRMSIARPPPGIGRHESPFPIASRSLLSGGRAPLRPDSARERADSDPAGEDRTMRILLTGASGQLGAYLIDHLAPRRADGLERLRAGERAGVRLIPST